MGFYLGILTNWPPPQGGVHKIQILIRDLLKEILQKIFGEEMGGSGGPRPPYYRSMLFLTTFLRLRPAKKEYIGLIRIFFSNFYVKNRDLKLSFFFQWSWRV